MHVPNIILAVLIPGYTRVDAIIKITGVSSVNKHSVEPDKIEIQFVIKTGEKGPKVNEKATTITNISAITFPSRTDRKTELEGTHHGFGLSDKHTLFKGEFKISKEKKLVDVKFTHASDITATDEVKKDPEWKENKLEKFGLDTEGMAFYNNKVYISTELDALWECPVDKTTVTDGCTPVGGDWTADYMQGCEVTCQEDCKEWDNKGAEALTLTNSETDTSAEPHFIVGMEKNIRFDDPGFIRLKSYSASNPQDVTRVLAYPRDTILLDSGKELDMMLTELISLDDMGLDGGQLLSLERGYKTVTNECDDRMPTVVRLSLISTADATDIKSCSVIDTCNPACGGEDTVPVSKEVIFEWTEGSPLKGVEVDNYEGMALLTNPAIGDDGAIWLMMASDDNTCKDQVGNQFVLIELDSDSVPFRKLEKGKKQKGNKKTNCPKRPKEESKKTKKGCKKSKSEAKKGKLGKLGKRDKS